MHLSRKTIAAATLFCGLGSMPAQTKSAFQQTDLPPSQRAADIVHRMTLEEKASQLVNQSRAIPRLGVPAYDWWSEALHGVARDGVTEFPEPVGLAATFDPEAIHTMATAIAIEGHVLNARAVKANGGSADSFRDDDPKYRRAISTLKAFRRSAALNRPVIWPTSSVKSTPWHGDRGRRADRRVRHLTLEQPT